VRSLAKPEVIKSAIGAALASAVLSYPRLALWAERKQPIWYLEAVLFLGGTVLWGFVLGWYTQYTRRPFLTFKIEKIPLVQATILGLLGAATLSVFVDPAARQQVPEDYPPDFQHWLAMVLFSLSFSQLLLIFAPLSWCLRLSARPGLSAVLTVVFGAVVFLLKQHRLTHPLPAPLLWELLVFRVVGSFLSLHLLARGGVLLVWWFDLLIQSRLLLGL
jgi:hypothetical protein